MNKNINKATNKILMNIAIGDKSNLIIQDANTKLILRLQGENKTNIKEKDIVYLPEINTFKVINELEDFMTICNIKRAVRRPYIVTINNYLIDKYLNKQEVK